MIMLETQKPVWVVVIHVFSLKTGGFLSSWPASSTEGVLRQPGCTEKLCLEKPIDR